MINSAQKGKRGEREAVRFLKSIGFRDARRTQQYNGLGKSDVICEKSLPNLHIEVKFGRPLSRFDIGTKSFEDAIEQANRDAGDLLPVILWKPYRLGWRLTFPLASPAVWATVGQMSIGSVLEELEYSSVSGKVQFDWRNQ